ncbi:MAG TPA: hypothetical protein DCW31_07485 [Lactobacillus sp.]|nr:hypothetical protein [Lactobacillus sp.]
MKKARVEAFSDAVIAIILTIMVLEIKKPTSSHLHSLMQNEPYILAFTISFIFICNAWYSHHYVLSVRRWFSKRAFWANNFWLFTMSFIPVATAWVSEFQRRKHQNTFTFLFTSFWIFPTIY